ncbi:MAG: ComEC/Rec2 family competence protein [Verrucomicrobia bacterium]|nr:ComEC/Rec2 family competence protein [Verrucomicrobiota bacterium]
MKRRGSVFFSLFFDRHPSLLPSLFFLIALSYAIKPTLALFLPLLALSLPLIHKPKKLFFLYIFGFLAFFYGKYNAEEFPKETSILKGSAIFSLSEIKTRQSHFKKTTLAQGTILSMLGDDRRKAYNIPCSIPISPSIRPFQYKTYKIQGTLEKKGDFYSFISDPETPWIGKKLPFCFPEWRFRIKNILKSYIEKAYPNTSVANFFTALTLGDLDDRLLRFSFNKLGLQHILAISGFHFSLLSFFIGYFLRLLFKEKTALLILSLLLTIYFLLLHNAPSIIRAYFAIIFYLTGKLLGYRPNALNLLGVTLFLELLIFPQSLTNLGFQLSFLATASILLFFPTTFSWMEKLLPKRTAAAALSLHPFEKITYLICSLLRSTLAVNLSVYLTLIPTCLWYFTSFPLISLVYNLFVPFTIFISLFLFLLAFPLGAIIPPIGSLIHQGNSLFTGKILQIITESPNCLDIPLTLPFLSEPFLYLYLISIFYFIISNAINKKNKLKEFI